MHILQLSAENVKRIQVVAITPKGPVIQITGPNESGKTSVLDAIWWALEGARHIQSEPIRKGASRARIKLDLGDLVVERKFTAKGTYLTVESADGRLFKQPQQILDALFGALTFDPLAFMGFDARKQYDVLTSTVALPVDPQAVAEKNTKTTMERTEVNREVTRLKGVIASLDPEIPDDLPADVPDTDALIAALNEANAKNGAVSRHGMDRERLAAHVTAADQRLVDAQQSLIGAEGQAETVNQALADFDRNPAPEPVDTEALSRDLEAARKMEAVVGKRKQRDEARQDLGVKQNMAQALGETIEHRREELREALASVDLPVDGLEIGDGKILFNGLPLDQASSARQLEISVAIAMAVNPKLKVLRIENGSLLDQAHMDLLTGMAIEHGYQVWIERVDESGKVGIVMSEGRVVADNQPAAAPTGDREAPGEAPALVGEDGVPIATGTNTAVVVPTVRRSDTEPAGQEPLL